jgi:putative transcriptional regulator
MATVRYKRDPDNPPMTDDELARRRPANPMRRARLSTGLTQAEFATRYRINLARLRDIEQGRSTPDTALLAYLQVIEREPEAVARALAVDRVA